MVRLKGPFLVPITQGKFNFQYHYGAIKRIWPVMVLVLVLVFNTTMVRLKEQLLDRHQRGQKVFQYHYGAIKSYAYVSEC